MIEIRFDPSQIATSIGNVYAAAGEQAPVAISRALNHTIRKAKTVMSREVVKQTGLKYGTIKRALKAEFSTPGTLRAAVYSRGGDISLKHFSPKEGGGGVSARPRGVRRHVVGAFLTSGLPGRRKISLRLNGHVFINVAGGKWRGAIKKVRSGVIIPDEMISGASAHAFDTVVARDLPGRLAHEVYRIL